jgi:ElaB/YqjD/DUF883 family membrane-anchored ribosome-binding protein
VPYEWEFNEKSDRPRPFPASTIRNAPVAGALVGIGLSCKPTKSSERQLEDEPSEDPTLRAMLILDAMPLLARTRTAVSESQQLDSPALEPKRMVSVAEKVPRFEPRSSMGVGAAAACTLLLGALLIPGTSMLNRSETEEVA